MKRRIEKVLRKLKSIEKELDELESEVNYEITKKESIISDLEEDIRTHKNHLVSIAILRQHLIDIGNYGDD